MIIEVMIMSGQVTLESAVYAANATGDQLIDLSSRVSTSRPLSIRALLQVFVIVSLLSCVRDMKYKLLSRLFYLYFFCAAFYLFQFFFSYSWFSFRLQLKNAQARLQFNALCFLSRLLTVAPRAIRFNGNKFGNKSCLGCKGLRHICKYL